MSLGLSSRLKHNKKHELTKSHSQAQILANKLRQDGVMATVESVLQAVDQVAALLSANDPPISYKDSVINLCQHLKIYGAYLEILYKDQLDHAFKIFRDRAQDDLRVDMLSRLHLLELIELRAKGWKGTEIMNQYYRKKLNQFTQIEMSDSATSLNESMSSIMMTSAATSAQSTSSSSPPLLGPGEIIKPSGKFTKPTRIPGKKYCKDEVVIRNADSGKVMGIRGRRVHMIEELSETIISFQRVNPGAKERLVQITGANEESINHAKQLIEETIRRNASPVREHGGIAGVGGPLTGSSSSINSSASDDSALQTSSRVSRALMHSLSTNDANLGEYKYTVVTNGCTIKITGDNLDLVRTSKLVLEEYFSGEPIHEQFYSFDSLPQPIVPNDVVDLNQAAPLTPPESLPSPGGGGGGGSGSSVVVTNGQLDDTNTDGALKIRAPRESVEEIRKSNLNNNNNNNNNSNNKNGTTSIITTSITTSSSPATNAVKILNLVYSIEHLAQLAMSPYCLTPPADWERILKDYPNLIRSDVEMFDAKQYLSNRNNEPTCVLSVDQMDLIDV